MDIVDANIDFKVIGERIKKARKNKGLSQQELSNMLNVPHVYVSNVERGQAGITLKKLAQISKALDVTMCEILTGASPQHDNYLNKDWETVLKKCSPAKQRLIYNIAKKIAEMEI